MAALARKCRQIFMAAVFTFHTGKAIVQITAIEIATDYLLDIGPSESVLPGEILIKDLEKGFKIIFNAAVVIRILRRNYMKKDILCQGDFGKGISGKGFLRTLRIVWLTKGSMDSVLPEHAVCKGLFYEKTLAGINSLVSTIDDRPQTM